ncbi:hypothetical protein [Nocardia sp. CC213A]|uniref:hypothetical protein n=1 Tax=Nocardia sp. CC213A TaxID=3044157 RepID=UPI00278C0C62|nr:hypothetical protein [Nocardia sp. CC213A]
MTLGVTCQSYDIGAVRMEVVLTSNGSKTIRLLDMDSAAVVELRGCQRARLQVVSRAWMAEHANTVIPADDFFELAGRLQAEGCTCDESRCAARRGRLRLVMSRKLGAATGR